MFEASYFDYTSYQEGVEHGPYITEKNLPIEQLCEHAASLLRANITGRITSEAFKILLDGVEDGCNSGIAIVSQLVDSTK